MSIGVAVSKRGEIWIGADTQCTFGEDRHLPPANYEADKLIQVGTSLVMASGWGAYEILLRNYVVARGEKAEFNTALGIHQFFHDFWLWLRETDQVMTPQPHPERHSPFLEIGAQFLVATPVRLFIVAGDLSVTECMQYAAIGSGDSYALGALYALYPMDFTARALVKVACEAAVAFNSWCGGEIRLARPQRAGTI